MTAPPPKADRPRRSNCLNLKLKQQVDQIIPSLTEPSASPDARSPDTRIGIVNVPAAQQQYEQNFGVSVIPYRPPPLIYTRHSGITDERRAEAVAIELSLSAMRHQVVQVEDAETPNQGQVNCLVCGEVFPANDGSSFLKYFLTPAQLEPRRRQ
jgi:hypothetical protein